MVSLSNPIAKARAHTVDGRNPAPLVFAGESSFKGFLDGTGFRPSAVVVPKDDDLFVGRSFAKKNSPSPGGAPEARLAEQLGLRAGEKAQKEACGARSCGEGAELRPQVTVWGLFLQGESIFWGGFFL